MEAHGTNSYCEQLGIAVPSLAAVRAHPEANTYALLIVTLLEHGRPMTLGDVAEEFTAAGVVTHVDDAYFSLKRCRPARPPVYRDGDLYALDPHDHELDLWAFRLSLRPPRVQRSCGISRPLGDEKKLRAYLAKGQMDKLAARLEADAKALFALHAYGKVHGCVRLRWGFLDQMFPAPWHHRDEPMLYHLINEAFDLNMGLVAVVGHAPAWDEPWSRARRLEVVRGEREYDRMLFDELGRCVDNRDVQLARLEAVIN